MVFVKLKFEKFTKTLVYNQKQTNEKILEISSKLTETNQQCNTLKASIADLTLNHKRLESAIFDNMDIIDKLSNCQTFNTTERIKFLQLT